MSWAVPSSEHEEIPAAIESLLHRRASPERLYWRLQRPRAGAYARAAFWVLWNRAVGAVAAVIAIAMCAFLGLVVGAIATARLPAARVGTQAIRLAVVHAVTEAAAWMPAFIVLGLILVIIPRPRLWIFRATMLGAGALGYCQRLLPLFPRSSVASAITERTAALTSHLALRLPSSAEKASALVLGAAALGYVAYRYAYGFTVRSTGIFPRRTVSHYHSTFTGLSVLRRLAAVPVAAAVFVASVWIAESIRAPLPGVRYAPVLFGYSHPSDITWLLAALIVAWTVCMPRPNGFQWLFILLLVGLAGYAFWPHVYLIRLPAAIPAAGPGSFWALVIAYLCVAGFGYNLLAALLDWP
jgi:hypothetical protein